MHTFDKQRERKKNRQTVAHGAIDEIRDVGKSKFKTGKQYTRKMHRKNTPKCKKKDFCNFMISVGDYIYAAEAIIRQNIQNI